MGSYHEREARHGELTTRCGYGCGAPSRASGNASASDRANGHGNGTESESANASGKDCDYAATKMVAGRVHRSY